MPQNKKSARIHALTGTYRADRHRQREPDVDGIGDPPLHLTDELATIWRELAASLPFGIGSTADRIAFEILAAMTSKMRTATLTAAETAQMIGLLGSFGLHPIGRQRLDPAPPPAPDDEPLSGLAKFRR